MEKQIHLRPLQKTDLEWLHQMYADAETAKYMRHGAHTSLEQTARLMEYYGEKGNFAYALVDGEETFVGYASLVQDKQQPGTYSVSIMISRDFQGHGYGGEGMRELLALTESRAEIRIVKAYILEQNVPSRRLAEKNGFSLQTVMEMEDGNRLCLYRRVL